MNLPTATNESIARKTIGIARPIRIDDTPVTATRYVLIRALGRFWKDDGRGNLVSAELDQEDVLSPDWEVIDEI